MEKQRNSSLECLRILCMFGIIFMHTFGMFYKTATGINLVMGTIINSIFNMGVSVFMLISGYFGIRFSSKKLVSLECTVLFYSILGMFFKGIILESWSASTVLKSILPISTKYYWYMSVYIIIFVCSGYINMFIDSLDKKMFLKFICLMLLFFSIMPTFAYYEIMGDNGKGLMNMVLMYLIGRYIKICNVKPSCRICRGVCIATVITCVLNYIFAMWHGGIGLFAPFARDNSLTIILSSIFMFLFFLNITFYSKTINVIAKGMFATYLCEGTIRLILNSFIPWEKYVSSWYLFVLISLYTIVVMIICLFIETIRKSIYTLFEDDIYKRIMNIWDFFIKKCLDWFIRL